MKRGVASSPLPCGWNTSPEEMNHDSLAVCGAIIRFIVLRPSTFSSSPLLPGIIFTAAQADWRARRGTRGYPVYTSLHWKVAPNIDHKPGMGVDIDIDIRVFRQLHYHPGQVRVREEACAISTRTPNNIHYSSTDPGARRLVYCKLELWKRSFHLSLFIQIQFALPYLDSKYTDLLHFLSVLLMCCGTTK